MKYIIFIILSGLFLLNEVIAQHGTDLRIIPKPNHIDIENGLFELTPETVLVADENLISCAQQLADYLEPATGFFLSLQFEPDGKKYIRLNLNTDISSLGEEGYVLQVKKENIEISAYHQKGIFYGIQTLRQLLPGEILREAPANDTRWIIPCLRIEDKPRFAWRGLMIDYSRTFWDIRLTKHIIDILALYKMNVFHMHLTDDQGWRIEIEKYPELTRVASQFHDDFDEPPEREGYYTQADIREIVNYAMEKNVTIVPEIEMPGHTAEVFAVFPELSCTGETFKIHPFFEGPGIHEEVLCAGNDQTFEFLENVLTEVSELFPSKYLHIGGDEVPKARWKKCPKCQKRIIDEGLADEDELQSWFIRRIEKHLNTVGKSMIGWNEILEGGIAPNAAIMFWHGDLEETLKAAEKGHPIVMSPTSHCYFDYTYEKIPTGKVYDFDPVPDGLDRKYADKILGCQANFWSHIDRTVPAMHRQIFPRLLALSEVGWTEKENKHWEDFSIRLKSNLEVLDILGIYYMDLE